MSDWRSVNCGNGSRPESHIRRSRAHNLVAKAVRLREMLPASAAPCVDCGEPATDYDHRDYSKPLDVEPVCRSCNMKRGPAQ